MEQDLRQFLIERQTLYEALDCFRFKRIDILHLLDVFFDTATNIETLYILKELPVELRQVIVEKIREWEDDTMEVYYTIDEIEDNPFWYYQSDIDSEDNDAGSENLVSD